MLLEDTFLELHILLGLVVPVNYMACMIKLLVSSGLSIGLKTLFILWTRSLSWLYSRNVTSYLYLSVFCTCSAFERAKDLVEANQYDEVISLSTEEIETPGSKLVAESLLLRATFHILMGQGDAGLRDLDALLRIDNIKPEVCAIECHQTKIFTLWQNKLWRYCFLW